METRRQGFRLTPDIFVAVMLVMWTVLNLFQAAFTDLTADEAYYKVLSEYPGWGYFDHPPMNMWLIWLSTSLLGESELAIRLMTVLMQPIALYLFWLTVRSADSNMRSAWVYVLIAFSMPMLQVWGWVSTPDGPLMLFAALLMWSYRKFLDTDQLKYALCMGASIALLGYSKYHGALFVGFLLISNLRILRSWKFWLALVVAAALFLPHIYWQYSNDWVSFRYHLSGRTGDFEWENLGVYVLNLLTTFNPFLTLMLIFFIANKALVSEGEIGRAMKWIMWGFVIFFLISVRNVHVQAQWLILVTYPVIYFVFASSEVRPNFRNFVRKQGLWVGLVFIAARIFLMCCPENFLIQTDFFDSKRSYASFAQKLDGMPFFGNSNYQFVSKLKYYGEVDTYGRPCVECRSSHYQFLNMEDSFKGKTVAVEVAKAALDSTGMGIPLVDTVIGVRTETVKTGGRKTKKIQVYDTTAVQRQYRYDTVLDHRIVWDTIQNYLPTERLVVEETGISTKTMTSNSAVCTFKIHNPYEYDIPVCGTSGYRLYMHVRYGRFSDVRFLIPWPKKLKVLPAGSTYRFETRVKFPEMIQSGEGYYGFTIGRMPFGSWYNSVKKPIVITNVRESTLVQQERTSKESVLYPPIR